MNKNVTVAYTKGVFNESDIGAFMWFEDGKRYKIIDIIGATMCEVRRWFDIFEWLEYAIWKAWFVIKREIYYWTHPEDPETRWYKGG